jgi:hypothetical protein
MECSIGRLPRRSFACIGDKGRGTIALAAPFALRLFKTVYQYGPATAGVLNARLISFGQLSVRVADFANIVLNQYLRRQIEYGVLELLRSTIKRLSED